MNFDKGEAKFEKKCLCVCVCVWRGGEGGHIDTKTACQTVSVEVKHRIHNVEHVVNSTFLNLKNSNF